MDETVNAVTKTQRIYSESPEEYENQMIALAMREVEDRIRKHIATSQELTTIMKMGSVREQLEKEKIKREIDFIKAKQEALESQKQYEELVTNALDAMKKYTGYSSQEYEYVNQ